MAKADTSVKYFHSAMPGAPVLNGTAGSLIAVLDACLVNGFGLKTVDSLVVAGNVATANISAGHSAEKDAVVLVAGATPAELNGEWKVASTTTTTITFVTAGILDQTASGAITLKLASAGWAKPYSGTNLAVYKPTDVTATGCLLRVDDTAAKAARLVGYETMSDVNTGIGPFPTPALRSGGIWWSKSSVADASARPWMLVSDGRFFYSARANYPIVGTNGNGYELAVFGDFLPTKSGDPFGCILTGQATDVSGNDPVVLNNYWQSYAQVGTNDLYAARSYTGLGSSTRLDRTIQSISITNASWTSGSVGGPYPNPSDGGLYMSPHLLTEINTFVFRGTSPGFYGCPQVVPVGAFAARDSVTGVSGLTGKTLKALTCMSSSGVCFFDITGPWR